MAYYKKKQESGETGFIQRIGRPKYKVGEKVLFYIVDDSVEYECYGKIFQVDANGTFGQTKEVSYDVEGPDYRDGTGTMLYKHICESQLQSFHEISENSE